MRLKVERIAGPQALRRIADECDRIARVTQPRLPFTTSDWLDAWWRLFREERAMVRDSFYLHTLRDERGALDHLLAHGHEWDWCLWEGVSAGSEAHAYLSRQPTFSWRRQTVDHVLTLPRRSAS